MKTSNKRRGVALLIVIGLLALLMISAVAFSIVMRTERSGASNFHHATAARQMLYTALSRAIDDINKDIGNNVYPGWTNEIFISNASNSDDARILSERSLWLIPQIFRKDLETAKPQWVPVVVEGRSVGRYAYIAVNASGLLDANIVFDPATNRWLGGSPKEIQLSSKGQFDVVNETLFQNDRKADGHYAALDELSNFNSGLWGAPTNRISNFEVFSYALEELQPDGKTPKIDISTLAKITSQKTEIINAFKKCGLTSKQAEWAYFGLVDYVDDDSVPAGANDAEKFCRPVTEAVPTLGQYCIYVLYENNAISPELTKHSVAYWCECRFNYPFVGTGAETFDVEIDIEAMSLGITPDEWNGLELNEGHYTTNTFISSADPTSWQTTFLLSEQSIITNSAFINPEVSMATLANVKIKNSSGHVCYQLPGDSNSGSGAPLEVSVLFDKTPFEKNIWSEAIDPRCAWDGRNEFWRPSEDLGPATITLESLKSKPAYSGYSPVFNGESLGSLPNFLLKTPIALAYEKINTDGGRDGSPASQCDPIDAQNRAYVANRELQSVGELGYLPIDRWLTITLYDHGHEHVYQNAIYGEIHNLLPGTKAETNQYHKVLDYFTLSSSNQFSRGLVNLNTRQTNALAAVLQELPLRAEYKDKTTRVRAKGAAGTNPNETDAASDLAKLFVRNGPYQRLSDIGRIWHNVDPMGNYSRNTATLATNDYIRAIAEPCDTAASGLIGVFGEFEREAIIRNTCDLLTTRQQIFTIILRADSFSPKFGFTDIKKGNVLATAHAVAQIWRDPVATDVGGGVKKHKCFVQYFKILEE